MKRNASKTYILITVLLDFISYGIIIPATPFLLEDILHANESVTIQYNGWLMFTFALMQFIFAPILGILSDRIGRRPVLMFSLIALGVNYIVYALAPTVAWLFASRIFAGIFGANVTTVYAYIADISSSKKRSQNFGLIGAAIGLGFIIGAMLSGLISSKGIRVPFFIAGGLSFINLLYAIFLLPESLKNRVWRPVKWIRANPFGALLFLRKYPAIIGFVISIFLFKVAGDALQSVWTFYTKLKLEWSITFIGISLATAGLFMAATQGGLIRWILPRLGHKSTIMYGLIIWGISMALFGLAGKTWMMFAIMVPYAVGSIADPAIRGFSSNQVPVHQQGELQGTITCVSGLTSIIGPPLMSGLFAVYTHNPNTMYFPGAPFVLGGFLILLCLVFVSYTFKKHPEIK